MHDSSFVGRDLETSATCPSFAVRGRILPPCCRSRQASFNLAVTLVEIVTRTDSAPRGRPSPSENHSGHLSKKPSKGTRFGSEEWELRREAQHLLLR